MLKILLMALSSALIFVSNLSAQSSPKRASGLQYQTFPLPKNVVSSQGIRYEPECPDPDIVLDIYYSKKFSGSPCILIFHGGDWNSRDEKDCSLMAAYFASKGYVCASAAYRLCPEYNAKDAVFDAKAALAWLKKNAARYGGDPNKIGVIGGGAGANLAAILALRTEQGIFKSGEDDNVQACVLIGARFSWDEKFSKKTLGMPFEESKKYMPSLLSPKGCAPILAMYSSGDKALKCASEMQKKCSENPFSLKVYKTNKRYFWNFNPFMGDSHAEVWSDALQFFDGILKKK